MLTILIVLMMMMIGALIHVIDYVHYLNLFIFGLIKWFLKLEVMLFLFVSFYFLYFYYFY
jgi:hypothetical protein